MMKKFSALLLCLALVFCAAGTAFAGQTDEWTDSTAEEIMNAAGLRFALPEEAEDVSFQLSGNAARMNFTLSGIGYAAFIQPGAEFENISDYEFDSWAIEDECMIGWCEARVMLTISEGRIYALCLWYDAAPGLMYAVSASADDLIGLDVQAAAEMVFAPLQDNADGLTADELCAALSACTGYEGTAGASLKGAIAAFKLAAFAAEKQTADIEQVTLSEAVTDALMMLTEEQLTEFEFNLQSIHSALTRAFTDYSSIRDLFDTAGIAEEMALLAAEERAFEHYTALYEQLMAAGLQPSR